MSLKHLITVGCISLVVSSTGYATEAANNNKAIIMINGVAITQQDYNTYVENSRSNRPHNHPTTENSELVYNELIQRELIRQDAIKKGLDKTPEFEQRMQHLQNNLLISTTIQQFLDENAIDDALLKAEYDKISEIEAPNEYKTRHILVKTEEEAKAIVEELAAGKDFGEVAKEKSIDKSSSTKGGDLGWIRATTVVEEFVKAVEKMEKGQRSAPVESKYGWHIIQLDDMRKVALPSFESMKDKIYSSVQNRQLREYITQLKEKSEVKILDNTTEEEVKEVK